MNTYLEAWSDVDIFRASTSVLNNANKPKPTEPAKPEDPKTPRCVTTELRFNIANIHEIKEFWSRIE